MKNTAIKITTHLEETVETYQFLKKKIKRITKELEGYKLLLEQAALEGEDNTIVVGDFKVRLSDATRENFNVKQAREILGNQILAPFTSTINYTRLTVKKGA